MALTDITFEAADSACPACRFTETHAGTRSIVHQFHRPTEREVRASLTFYGPDHVQDAFVSAVRASGAYDDVEVITRSGNATTLRVSRDRAPDASNAGLLVLDRIAAHFGPDVLLDSCRVEGGVMRARIVLAGGLDSRRALERLQQFPEKNRPARFRIIRVSDFKGRAYADTLRRVITPEQEDVLRLALDLGYYASPKGCNLENIATRLGLSVSPVHKKLKRVEQVLVDAYVDPALIAAPDLRRRRPAWSVLPLTSHDGLLELDLRAKWERFVVAAYTAEHPGVRVLFQPLGEDEAAGEASALLVIVAAPTHQENLLARVRARASVRRIDTLGRDGEHLTVILRTAIGAEAELLDGVNPFPALLGVLGHEINLTPSSIENGWVTLNLVLPAGLNRDEVRSRIDEVSKGARWETYEVMNARTRNDAIARIGDEPGQLTSRQEEVLKIAHAMGYYRTPRACTLEGIARTLGISANAIHKNLTSAELKIFSNYLSRAW